MIDAARARLGSAIRYANEGRTKMDKYEIAVLAEDYEAKQRYFRMLQMMNTRTDPEERRKQSIEYHVAEAEMLEAWKLLERAKMK